MVCVLIKQIFRDDLTHMRDSDDLQKTPELLDALIARHKAAMSFVATDTASTGSLKALQANAMEARLRSELISYVPKTRSDAMIKLVYFAALIIILPRALDDAQLMHLRNSIQAFTD